MKVITQLVQHFWQRGVLNADDAEYLVRSGFVRERDLEGFKLPADEEPTAEPVPPSTTTPVGQRVLESVQESLIRRGRKRRGKGASKRPTIEPKGLSARVQKELRRRAEDLDELITLCQPKISPKTWEEAASHLRGTEPMHCRSLLRMHLKRGDVRLARL